MVDRAYFVKSILPGAFIGFFFMPRHQKVAGYYVIPSEILSVRPSVCLSVRANIRGLGASLSMIMRFIPLRIHWVALKPIFFYVLGATSLWEFNMEVAYKPKMLERPSVRLSVSAHHHSCIGNSSYSFRPILLKLYRCFKDGLKICILFFQNPEIIFYHFFPIFNLDIFRALILQICIWSMYLVSATPPTVFGESFWNFTGVLRMVWRYAYCFFRILKLFFITFFPFLT